MDFATAVHEHVIGLRSWNRRTVSPPSTPRAASSTTRPRNGAVIPMVAINSSRLVSSVSSGLNTPACEALGDRRGSHRGDGGDAEQEIAPPGQEKEAERDDLVARPPGEGTPGNCSNRSANYRIGGSMGRRNEVSPPSSGIFRQVDVSTPWLGWDISREVSGTNNNTAAGGDGCDVDAKAEWKGRREEAEEPKSNRAYGTTPSEREASVNKLMAFQTDRVVRVLDRMF